MMKQSFAHQSICLLTSLSILFSGAGVSAQTNSSSNNYVPPQTQVGDGGGGFEPPKNPPTDYWGSAGMNDAEKRDLDRRLREHAQGGKSTSSHKFLDLYGVSKSGYNIYYEGSVDSLGRERVFLRRGEFALRGTVNSGAAGLDDSKVVYEKTWEKYSNLKAIITNEAPIAKGNSHLNEKALVRHSNVPAQYPEAKNSGGLPYSKRPLKKSRALVVQPAHPAPTPKIEVVRPKTRPLEERAAAAPQARFIGELLQPFTAHEPLIKGQSTPTFKVYYAGKNDSKGRGIVFMPEKYGQTDNWQRFKMGALNIDGTVEWFNHGNSIPAEKLLSDLRSSKNKTTSFTERLAELSHRILEDYSKQKAKHARIEVQHQKANSNYPEATTDSKGQPVDKREPLPKEKSLVVQNSHPSPTTVKEYVVNPSNSSRVDSRFRPSNIAKTFAGNGFFKQTKQEVKKFLNGEPNLLIKSDKSPSKLETIKNFSKVQGVELTSGALAFYAAVGMIAGLTLMTDKSYSNNPAAWNSFIANSTDPASAIQLVSFMAFAGGTVWAGEKIITRVGGTAALSKVGVQPSLFMGGMIVAAIAGTILGEMMADPNTGKFIKSVVNGNPDMVAFDALYDKWTGREDWNTLATNQILPVVANVTIAGGATYAAMSGIIWLLNRQFMAAFIRSATMRIGWAPTGGPVIGAVKSVGTILVFLGAYQISDSIFQVGKSIREYFTADWSFSGDPAGNSIRDSRNKLFSEWERLKSKNFPSSEIAAFSESQSNIRNLIKKYLGFQKAWRDLQFEDTQNAYSNWRLRNDYFSAMYEHSFDFYKEFLDRMATQNGAQASLPDYKFLQDFSERKTTEATPTWEILKSAKDSNGTWTHPFADTWQHVQTNHPVEYMLTSMACGPEVEGYGQDNSWSNSISNFVGNYITGNVGPKSVVDDSTGWDARFYPPRLVNPIGEGKFSVCELQGAHMRMAGTGETLALPPMQFAIDLTRPAELKYNNLLDFTVANVRSSVLSDNESHFESWWNMHTQNQVLNFYKDQQQYYDIMLKNNYAPALVNSEYKWCSIIQGEGNKNSSLKKIMLELTKNGSKLDCPADAFDRLANGQLNSLSDELKLILALKLDLLDSTYPRLGSRHASLKEAHAAALQEARSAIESLNALLEIAKGGQPFTTADLERHAKDFVDAVQTMAADHMVAKPDDTNKPEDYNNSQLAQRGLLQRDIELTELVSLLYGRSLEIISQTQTLISVLTYQ